ncbi:MAG TPA: SDR family NAD(P)-dependent oxidoreductase, partial [Quisquiliibacterium sp.]|nr:SDR family NAD(P)-dependent oxidoreductase [Quisquiliibacterium sp.]
NCGTVVTVSSAAGLVGVARLTDYCASKWAAVGFDESLRAELARQGSAVRTLVACPYYVNTGMFDGVRTRFPRLLPILEPAYVADRIVGAVASGRRRLFMPRFVWATLAARLLPTRAFDAVAGFFGINSSMDDFTGRRDRPPG